MRNNIFTKFSTALQTPETMKQIAQELHQTFCKAKGKPETELTNREDFGRFGAPLIAVDTAVQQICAFDKDETVGRYMHVMDRMKKGQLSETERTILQLACNAQWQHAAMNHGFDKSPQNRSVHFTQLAEPQREACMKLAAKAAEIALDIIGSVPDTDHGQPLNYEEQQKQEQNTGQLAGATS
jgi:hypothetical protein